MQKIVSRSVTRLIQVLEVFERERRPLTSAQISAALDGPRSSIAALLKEMVELSALAHDRRTTTYFPSARFARLTGWLASSFIANQAVLEFLEILQERIVETALVAMPIEQEMEVVHIVRGSRSISYWTEPGRRYPIIGSAGGTAYLSTVPKTAIQTLFARAQRSGQIAGGIDLETLLKRVAQAGRDGYSVAFGAVDSDVAAICAPLPEKVGPKPLVLSISGPIERLRDREHEIISIVAEEIERMNRDDATMTAKWTPMRIGR
jgi:IclR family transcriptional regulator, KDG regulon repressor